MIIAPHDCEWEQTNKGNQTPWEHRREKSGKLFTMRYSAPALCVATSWLTRRVAAFVIPSRTTTSYARRHASPQHLCSSPASRGRPASAGLGRSLPGWKRRVATAMSTGDGARWEPIPGAPNMQVSYQLWTGSLRSRGILCGQSNFGATLPPDGSGSTAGRCTRVCFTTINSICTRSKYASVCSSGQRRYGGCSLFAVSCRHEQATYPGWISLGRRFSCHMVMTSSSPLCSSRHDVILWESLPYCLFHLPCGRRRLVQPRKR